MRRAGASENNDADLGPVSSLRASQHFRTLDGWRAVAILIVMLHHGADSIKRSAGGGLVGKLAGEFYDHGRWGVNVFFGISGFLICSRLLSERHRYGRIGLGGFYIRRASRILPSLLMFLLIVGLLGARGILDIDFNQWLSALGFCANYFTGRQTWYLGHFWSLAVEEHFYLLWPAILASSSIQSALRIGVGLALVVGAWRWVDQVFQIFPEPPPMARTDTLLDGLMWGCVFAILYDDSVWRAKLQAWTHGWRLLGCLLALGALAAIPIAVSKAVGFLPAPGYFKVWASAPLSFATPLLLVATVSNSSSWLARVLERAPLPWLGRLSYSLYLWQQLFLVWNKWRSPRLAVAQAFPLNFALAIACAAASYYLLERPLVAFGARLSQSLRERRESVLQGQ